MKTRLWRWVWPTLFFLFSLAALRQQILRDLKMTLFQGLQLGITQGWLLDAAAALLPLAVATFFHAVFRLRTRLVWIISAIAVWGGTYANVTYFRFFDSRLHWWIVQYYTGDVVGSRESVGSLSFTLPMVVSICFLLFSFLSAFWARDREKPLRSTKAVGFVAGLVLLIFSLFQLVQFPSRQTRSQSLLISNQVFKIWWESFKISRRSPSMERPDRVLSDYRRWGGESTLPPDLEHPLWYKVSPLPAETAKLRQSLGLPVNKPINIVLVFVESFRAYEFLHPKLGPEIFPELRKLAREKAILFTQTYTSAGIAGMTARGQFSSICSMIPRLDGPAPYISHPDLGIECLPQALRKLNYRNLWFHTLDRNYHNTAAFESRHGTDEFFDRPFFVSRGLVPEGAAQGIKDRAFLRESLNKILEEAATGHPVYSNLLTYSTHHPFVPIPEGVLSEPVRKLSESSLEYQGYLSKFRYADQALSEFVRDLFASPIGDNTLIVMLGDHGVNVAPTLNLNALQMHELRYRIPLFFFTKHMPRPQMNQHLAHQVDIAPTIGGIVGVKDWVSWLGHNILETEGSPFLTLVETGVAYRTRSEVCYPDVRDGAMQCWTANAELDPLRDGDLERRPEDQDKSRFFETLAKASSYVIENDWFKKTKPQ